MSFQINVASLKPVSQNIPSVSDEWNFADYSGNIKVRLGIGRDNYKVAPGLYKIGNPNSESDVLVSANYKLSFDILRKNLKSLNAWILVIDTKGVNVWCAAGKGTFGTENIIKEIKRTSLDLIVKHRRLILPQLGAPGVAAHVVKEVTGFKIIYGPIRAIDIKPFINANYKATPEMREMTFPLKERAKLIPVDFLYGKYKLLLVLAIIFILSGIDRNGLLFSKMLSSSLFPMLGIISAYFAGIVLTPLLLPYVPFKAFSVKGAVLGALTTIVLLIMYSLNILESISIVFIGTAIASFVAMNFTGSSTYTSLSGVKKEMKWSIPFQIAFALIGCVVFITSKLI
jgi:acetyl-CoA decarbonylase/synthase complex subunit gamma